jgi:P pilus assembly chaperone PapD
MSANAAAPAAAAEAPKSKKKGKQNDGINNRLQIVMRCARVPLFPAPRCLRRPRAAAASTLERSSRTRVLTSNLPL